MGPDPIDTNAFGGGSRWALKRTWTHVVGVIAAVTAVAANLSQIFVDLPRYVFLAGIAATIVLGVWSIGVLYSPARLPAARPVRRVAHVCYAVSLIAIGVLLVPTRSVISKMLDPEQDEIVYYTAYVSVEGDEETCAKGECALRYKVAGLFRAAAGKKARYVDRVKTNGRIESLVTVPAHVVLNPGQYPANPTYMEFAIPAQSNTVEPRAELVLRKSMTPQVGKIGLHLPYRTKALSVMVDLTRLGFQPNGQISASTEVLRDDGVSDAGSDLAFKSFQNGKFLITTARELPPRTSIVIKWGEP